MLRARHATGPAAAATEARALAEEEEQNVKAPTKAGLLIEDDALFNSKFNKWDAEECASLKSVFSYGY